MDPNLLSGQEELSNKRKKEKKSKKDKKRKLAAEAEEEAAAEEAAKNSKKRAAAKEESGQGGGVEKSVAVTGKGFDDAKYAPLKSFAAAALPPQVLDCCKGFERPSPIQALAWPYLLDGRDLIGIAATGSGKTIAFGVPALMHVRKKLGEKAAKNRLPRCLMLAPTRELAQQINANRLDWIVEKEEAEEAGCFSGRRAMRTHGGGRATSAPSSPNGSTTTSKIWSTGSSACCYSLERKLILSQRGQRCTTRGGQR